MILIIYSVIFNAILLFSNMRNNLFRYILLLTHGGAFAYFLKTEECSLSIVTLMLIVPPAVIGYYKTKMLVSAQHIPEIIVACEKN